MQRLIAAGHHRADVMNYSFTQFRAFLDAVHAEERRQFQINSIAHLAVAGGDARTLACLMGEPTRVNPRPARHARQTATHQQGEPHGHS